MLTLSPLGSGTLLQNGSVGPNITNFWFHGLTPGAYYEIEVTATLRCMDTARQTVTAQTSKGFPWDCGSDCCSMILGHLCQSLSDPALLYASHGSWQWWGEGAGLGGLHPSGRPLNKVVQVKAEKLGQESRTEGKGMARRDGFGQPWCPRPSFPALFSHHAECPRGTEWGWGSPHYWWEGGGAGSGWGSAWWIGPIWRDLTRRKPHPTAPEHHDSSTALQPHPRRTSCRSFARPQPEPEQQRQPGLTARLLGSRQRAAGWLPAHPVPQRLTGAGEKCIRPTKRHRVPV